VHEAAGICIAIDGPAASGKGTVARAVARLLDYQYLDTGAMYRSVALLADEQGVPWTDAPGLARIAALLDLDFRWDGEQLRILLEGRDVSRAIRAQRIGEGASAVAVHPAVRRALVARQQHLATRGGVVMDGRDIGTVVLPRAELKIYLDASLDERARRRWAELKVGERSGTLDEIRAELGRRDAQDSGRSTGPLQVAQDAVVVDTTCMSISEAVRQVVELATQRGARARSADAGVEVGAEPGSGLGPDPGAP